MYITTYREGDLVHIDDETLGIHDIGKVLYMIPGEMFPYQVLLEKGDNDGHRVYRFNENQMRPYGEEPEKPAFPVVEVVQPRQTFLKGQQYYAEKRASGTHYNLYTVEMKPRGVMPVDMFKITPYDVPITFKSSDIITSNTKPLQKVKTRHKRREAAKKKTAEIVAKTIKERKIKKAKTIYDKMELLGQINIFDILEGGA